MNDINKPITLLQSIHDTLRSISRQLNEQNIGIVKRALIDLQNEIMETIIKDSKKTTDYNDPWTYTTVNIRHDIWLIVVDKQGYIYLGTYLQLNGKHGIHITYAMPYINNDNEKHLKAALKQLSLIENNFIPLENIHAWIQSPAPPRREKK